MGVDGHNLLALYVMGWHHFIIFTQPNARVILIEQ